MYLSQGQSKIQYTRVTHNSKNETADANILCRYVLTFLALKGGANVIILNNTEQKLNKYQILVRRLKISKPLLTGFFFPLLVQFRLDSSASGHHSWANRVDSKRNSCMEFMVLHRRQKDREKNLITGVSLGKILSGTKHFSLPHKGSDCVLKK